MDAHAVPSAGDWALDRNGAIFLQGGSANAQHTAGPHARTHFTARDLRMCSHVAADALQCSAVQRSTEPCNATAVMRYGRVARRDHPHHICTGTGTQLSSGRDRARAVRLVCVRPARWQRCDGLRARKPALTPYPLYPLIPLYPEALNARTACPHLASFLATAGRLRAGLKQTIPSADT